MDIRIFKILKNTKVEGPENRYCIWVQGCSHHCKGCQAIHTWSKNAGIILNTEDIIEDIKNQNNIEGVTFLGGEPFEQSIALGEIAKEVKKLGLGVLCFTGGILEELKIHKEHQTLLSNIDLLIDGPFQIDNKDFSRPWCGSSNQKYHFLTNRYNKDIFIKYKNKVELNIEKNGTIFMNGMGDFSKLMKDFNLISLCEA